MVYILVINMHITIYKHINGTMPQVEINPLAQIHASYEASALPPSHHGWIAFSCFLFLCEHLLFYFFGFLNDKKKIQIFVLLFFAFQQKQIFQQSLLHQSMRPVSNRPCCFKDLFTFFTLLLPVEHRT